MKKTTLFLALALPAISSPAGAADQVDPGVFFQSQNDGLAAIVTEIDALDELVEIVSRLPGERSEYVVNYARLKTDIRLIKNGVLEAIEQPRSAPRSYPPVNGDYLE